MMHDATGVDTADPMLVDYLLAKVDTPLREALLRRYQGRSIHTGVISRAQTAMMMGSVRTVLRISHLTAVQKSVPESRAASAPSGL